MLSSLVSWKESNRRAQRSRRIFLCREKPLTPLRSLRLCGEILGCGSAALCYHHRLRVEVLLVFQMRRLVAVLLAALVVLYGVVALHLFLQERGGLEIPAADEPNRIQNPEVALGLVQTRFEANRFREDELELLRRALRQAPSFYEPSFLLATFHASRLSEPAKVRAAYEAAVARYPANGRLQLSYGTWLLESRARLDGWRSPEEPSVLRDPLPDAELHLKTAMALEPELSWAALGALSRNRVPPARWGALVPDHPLARTHFLDALFQAGPLAAGWGALGGGVLSSLSPLLFF